MDFFKYQGAGNDFIMVDQRARRLLGPNDTAAVARLCDRRFGIGADGLILLEPAEDCDFEMIYFNADGRIGSMCGNGGRCAAAFARHLGLVREACTFRASDGMHAARFTRSLGRHGWWVELHMTDVRRLEQQADAYVLDTGSPHYVRFVGEALEQLDMVQEGRAVRYSEPFREKGINVNMACPVAGGLRIRTYERGVEDETLACGTGVTAAALADHRRRGAGAGTYETTVHARGGDLAVRFTAQADGSFTDIWLCGPAQFVFQGEIETEF